MTELMNDEIYKKIDEVRIKKALGEGNYNDALVLFNYSSLSKEEFNEIKASFSVPDKNEYVRNPKKGLEITPENESWIQILHIISNKISKPSFDTWIKGTKGIIEENKITVICNNEFQRDWLEERYRELISATAEEVLGKEYKIIFQVQ